MIVEFIVLRREDGLHHPRRNVLELHPRAVFLEELRYQPALAVVDLRGEARLVRQYLRRRRQGLRDLLEEEQAGDCDGGGGYRRGEHERGKKFRCERFFPARLLIRQRKILVVLVGSGHSSIPPKRFCIYDEIISHGASPPERRRRHEKRASARDALLTLIFTKVRYLPSFFVRPKVFANMKRMTRMPT